MLATFELFLSSMLTFSYWNAPSSTAYSKFLAFAALILPAATAAYALYVNFAFKDQCANTQDNVFRWKLGIFYYHYKHKTN